MNEALLQTLRVDFRAVAVWFLACGEWSEADVAEIGQSIAEAAQRQDAGELVFWSEWMARHAVAVKAHGAQMAVLEHEAAAWWSEQMRRAA